MLDGFELFCEYYLIGARKDGHSDMTNNKDQQEARRAKREAREAAQKRLTAALSEARDVVATGVCPTCGRPLRRNLALLGWWQCSQFGADGFRADSTQPSCDFQTFIREELKHEGSRA
jgi:ribosomal protein L37AE/L43A